MMIKVKDKTFDEERALYNITEADIENCIFAGPSDGESVLKEARDIILQKCSFSLRYPLWHVQKFKLIDSAMDDKTRAPIWYSVNGQILGCKIQGVKCVRECKDISIDNCDIESPEFAWKSENISILNSKIESEYLLFGTNNVKISNLDMKGKYSFQYMNNLVIKYSNLDTKDAFWHSKNVTVENSIVKGEYLGWFSENLTLINCKIIGTQPLCYCKGLKLINCTMEETDLSFEYSEVDADVIGNIISVKNPKLGTITADSIDEIFMEDAVMECKGKVYIRGREKSLV